MSIRINVVLLCCLLIFFPMNQIGVKAEEVTTVGPSEPEPVAGTEEETKQTCPEENNNTTSSANTATDGDTSQNSEIADSPETDTGTDTESNTCEEATASEINPETFGIAIMGNTFTDVSSSYWAYKNIQHLASLNVINGYENADKTYSFKPEDKVTRAQAAKMIIEAIGEKEASVTKQIFNDIPVGYWAAGYIHRAYELGIFKGYEGGNFGPNDTLKRSQMAKVIIEGYDFTYNGYTSTLPVFFDVNKSYWAYEYIEKMHYNGLSNGSNYRFLPENVISRAQFSAFLSRAIEPSYRLKITGPISTQGKVISKTSLNIRASASSTARIIGSLTPGTFVNISEFNGFWAKINHNGITGFVHKSYLKLYSADPNYPLKGRIIVLDPGHGYEDPGTQYSVYEEKDIVLSVAKKVADRLRKAGAKVIMTRDSDTSLELEDRVRMAQDAYGELFVSIHVNSVENSTTARGTETFFNTSNNMNGAESKLLAYEIQKQIVVRGEMYDRGIKESEFYVITNNQIPAVLVEMGFLSNREDRAKLITDQYQTIYADSIYQGIKNYYLK